MQESFKIPSATFPTLTGSIVTFNSQYAGLPLKSHSVEVVATQSGSGTPSPSNPRPISGYSAINISATGLNLWGGLYLAKSFDGKTNYYNLDTVNKYFVFRRSVKINDSWIVPLYTNFKANTQYTLILTCSLETTGRNNCLGIKYTDNTDEIIDITNDTKETRIFVTNASKSVSYIYINYQTSTDCRVYYDESGLLEGVHTVDDFEPFGTYTTIQIGSTVYGGEYDARTGVLTVTHLLQSITSMQKAASGTFFYDITNGIASADMLCNMAEFGAIVTSHSQAPSYAKQVCLQQQSATNLRVLYYNADYTYEDWQTFISNNPFVVCVEVQPTTIQLPPCPIETLEGVNNIWSDTGDTTLQYPKFG